MKHDKELSRGPRSWNAKRGGIRLSGVDAPSGGRFFGSKGEALSDENYAGLSSPLISQIMMQLSGEEFVLEPFLENVFVRAAVKAVQNGFSQLDFAMWSGDPSLPGSTIVDNPLSDLLRRPNREMTGRDLWVVHANSMKLDGECYWFLANSLGNPVSSSKRTGLLSGKISQIIPVRGSSVQVNCDPDGWPVSYSYAVSGGRQSKEFPWGSVIAFRDYDPYDVMRGTGDVQCAVRAIDLQHQVLRYMDATLRNGGGPGGFIIFKDAVSPAELERRQAEADDNNSTEERRRLKILDRDAKYIPNNMSPSDMEYATLWDRMIDAILICLGVPGPVVGRYTDATYNNVSTAYKQMWRGPNGILSISAHAADIIQNKLRPRMVREYPEMAGLVAHFDSSKVVELQENQHNNIKLGLDIASSGIGVSLNDAMALAGATVRPVDGGDMRLVRANQTDTRDSKKYTTEQLLQALELKKNGKV